MDTKQYLENYYQNYNEDTRFSSKHGNVEYFTTMHYIQQYLKPGMRILEIGAATGRYSHALAQQGYPVDAVELIEHNIEIFRRNTAENEPITIQQGNATNLSAFADILPCYWGPCTTCLPPKKSTKPCQKPSASPGQAA